MIKAIEFYLRKNVSTPKIRKYLNEIFDTDLTETEIKEAIENIQGARTKQEQVIYKVKTTVLWISNVVRQKNGKLKPRKE